MRKFLHKAERSTRRLLCWLVAAPVIVAAFVVTLAWVMLSAVALGLIAVCALLLAGLGLLAMDGDTREAIADLARRAKE